MSVSPLIRTIDGPTELGYLREGGILPAVLRRLYRESVNQSG